jgi:hypothetical protein
MALGDSRLESNPLVLIVAPLLWLFITTESFVVYRPSLFTVEIHFWSLKILMSPVILFP